MYIYIYIYIHGTDIVQIKNPYFLNKKYKSLNFKLNAIN